MNLARPYMGPTPDPNFWRDLSVVVQGPAVANLESLFFSDWAFATGEKLTAPPQPRDGKPDEAPEHSQDTPRGGAGMVQVVASGPDVPDDPLYESLVSSIFAAGAHLDRDSLFRARRDARAGPEPRSADEAWMSG